MQKNTRVFNVKVSKEFYEVAKGTKPTLKFEVSWITTKVEISDWEGEINVFVILSKICVQIKSSADSVTERPQN